MRVLDAALGHDLFERGGRGLVLTKAGRIALDHAEAIFRTVDDLAATLRETVRGRRALRIGVLATLSRNFQMQFLRPLIGRADVEVALRLLARDGAGLAVIRPIVVRDELQAGTLIDAAQFGGISETFYAVTLQRRFSDPLLAEVLMRHEGRGAEGGVESAVMRDPIKAIKLFQHGDGMPLCVAPV